MSWSHIFRFNCDAEGCDAFVERKEDSGAMPGWIWVTGDGRTTHRCPAHRESVAKGMTVGEMGSYKGRIHQPLKVST